MENPKYSIDVVYKDLMGTTDKVYWATAVWNRAVIPRSRFVVWLAYLERLKTKQRLKSIGVVDDDLCPICRTQTKTLKHLFFKCNFSVQCTKALINWIGVNWNIGNMKGILWKCHLPKAKSQLIPAIFCNLVYAIWKVRNDAVWQKKLMTVGRVANTIKAYSKIRFVSLSLNGTTAFWLRNL